MSKTAVMPRDTLTQLVEFYELEEQLYRLLLRVTEVQLEALRARATPAEFLLLTEKKENILRSIERVDRCVQPLKLRYVEEAAENGNGNRNRLDHALDHILELINQIADNEQGSRELLEQWDAERAGRKPAPAHMHGFETTAAHIRFQVEDPAC